MLRRKPKTRIGMKGKHAQREAAEKLEVPCWVADINPPQAYHFLCCRNQKQKICGRPASSRCSYCGCCNRKTRRLPCRRRLACLTLVNCPGLRLCRTWRAVDSSTKTTKFLSRAGLWSVEPGRRAKVVRRAQMTTDRTAWGESPCDTFYWCLSGGWA
jgi:hypothetical protein